MTGKDFVYGEAMVEQQMADRFQRQLDQGFQRGLRTGAGPSLRRDIASRRVDIGQVLAQATRNQETNKLREQLAALSGFSLSETLNRMETTRAINGELSELRSELRDIRSQPAPAPQVNVEVVPIFIPAPQESKEPEPQKPTIDKDPDVLDQSENPHKDLIIAALKSGVLVKVPQKLLAAKLRFEGVPLELPLSGQMTYQRSKTIDEIEIEDRIYFRRHGRFPDDLPGPVQQTGEAVADGEGNGKPGKLTAALQRNGDQLDAKIVTPNNLAGNILGVGAEKANGQMELTFLQLEDSTENIAKQSTLGNIQEIANIYLPARAWPVDGLEGQVMADLLSDSALRDSEDPKLSAAWRKFLALYGAKIPTSARFSLEAALASQPEPEPTPIHTQRSDTGAEAQPKSQKESEIPDDPHKAEILKAVNNGSFVKIPEDVVKKMIAKAGPEGKWVSRKTQPGNVLNLKPPSIFGIERPYVSFVNAGTGMTVEIHEPKSIDLAGDSILYGLGIEREGNSFELKLVTAGPVVRRDSTTIFDLDRPESVTNLYLPKKAWHLAELKGDFLERLVLQTLSSLGATEKHKWIEYMKTHTGTLGDDFRFRVEAGLYE